MSEETNWEAIISVIGSFASIGGAIWAFVEADKAAQSVTKAESVRDELINRRELIEVSKVHSETTRILKVASRVGPSSDLRRLIGFNAPEVASEIEEYVRFLSEHSSHFSELFENTARDLCDSLRDDISVLADARDPQSIKDIGKVIYNKIHGFLPTAKMISDLKRESVPVK
ncbi:hypothetical protein ACKOZB_004375 [Vibrio parahaemolyticus]|nr:hypothetical protein [Vibrio parahaemolyticus]EGR0930842.1 hypothetical protein [Vibrio parahaemolyticus]EGR3234477.1 hypothetical protein [Vibrio parahaemolyticus]EHR4996462.1 hypothetical protein [Vibrio parahaemolyticus]EHR6686562.1 hypothetical protein [Vibrio parahaemolyticus]